MRENTYDRRQEPKEFEEKVLMLRRVSKKTTGGSSITFSALVVVGDGKGKVGLALGRSAEVPAAIQKAIAHAKRKMIVLPLHEDTIPHSIRTKFKAASIILKPAPKGAGLKVGSVLRSVLSAAGVKNASGKLLGSRNKVTNAYAVMNALKKMKERKPTVAKK